jgi:hypothetical protein
VIWWKESETFNMSAIPYELVAPPPATRPSPLAQRRDSQDAGSSGEPQTPSSKLKYFLAHFKKYIYFEFSYRQNLACFTHFRPTTLVYFLCPLLKYGEVGASPVTAPFVLTRGMGVFGMIVME